MIKSNDSETDPLIITLKLNDEAQEYFDSLRTKHFPPSINYLKAHLTLFHHLPANERALEEALIAECDMKPFSMVVTGLRHTGFGTAFQIHSTELLQLRGRLALSFKDWLIPQDRQRFQPHITVQNKVTPEASRQLVAELQNEFRSFEIGAEGLETWFYKGGPWEHAGSYPFTRRENNR